MVIGIVIRVVALGIYVFLAALVYRRNPHHATNVLLAALSLNIAAWGIVNEFSIHATTPELTLWLARGTMMMAAPLTIFFFLLVYTFPRPVIPIPEKALAVIGVLTLIVMGTAMSPYLFTQVSSGVGAGARVEVGPGIVVFLSIAVVSIVLGIYSLITKSRHLKTPIEKHQNRYLLMGTFTMFALIMGGVMVPIILGRSAAGVQYQVLFTLPFVAATSYAIVRHRLMDIRVAVARSVSFSLLVGSFFLFYALLLIFAVPFVSRATNLSDSIIAAIGALMAVLLAQYTQETLRKVTDRILFQRRTNYHAGLVTVSQRLSRTIEIDQVTSVLLKAIEDFVRSGRVVVYLQESEGQEFVPSAASGVKLRHVSIPANNPLVRRLQKVGHLVIRDELLQKIEKEQSESKKSELTAVKEALEWMDVMVAVPLFVDKGLTGLILLNEKKSGDPYLSEDVEFLSALAPQAATALENARLYNESLEFSQRLQEEVERATHELEAANMQLRQLDKAKSEFLSIASHQLYTPLTAIRGYLSMLREGDYGKISDKQEPVIDIIDKSADRLIELIKSLLDISRIESGRLELKLERANLAELAKELVQDLMPNAMNKNLQLLFHEPREAIPFAIVDRQRIRQVMLNFIDNAIKYTDRGHVDVYVQGRGSEIEFVVSDTGTGISKEEIARLFNKFTRVGGASRYHTEGTGLGLYVARQIVREHHGEVRASSPGPGRGSTFIMRLPVEASGRSLHLGDEATVEIKAAEA